LPVYSLWPNYAAFFNMFTHGTPSPVIIDFVFTNDTDDSVLNGEIIPCAACMN